MNNLRSILWFIVSSSAMVLTPGMSAKAQNLVPDQIEFEALRDFYEDLGGPNWTVSTNWPTSGNWPTSATSAQFGTWHGVTVVNGDISFIILRTNNLTGNIPESIGSLASIVQLYLDGNAISGHIPASIGNLNKLTRLHLNSNQLTGGIPQSIGNLVNLKLLFLERNQLTGSIPRELGNLTDLEQLYLRYNQLSGSLPESIGNLIKLRLLFLHNNKLTGPIPASVGSLTLLTHLYVNNNSLSGTLPESMGNMVGLTSLAISNNQFSGPFPSTLGNLVQLTHFNASVNKFSGGIPASFANLSNLYLFYIGNNLLSGEFPSLVGNWTALGALEIQNNSFEGPFPGSIGNCNKLTYVSADYNKFTNLPESILTLPLLSSFRFTNNELVSIPAFQNQANKSQLSVILSSNRLDFSFLEPLINCGLLSLNYAGQVVKDVTKLDLIVGQPLSVPSRPFGQHSTVTWQKLRSHNTWVDVNPVNQDATHHTFTRNSAALSDEGTYRWKMTNTLVAGLTLICEPIEVKTPAHFITDQWSFQYRYDDYGRVIGQKAPGMDWVHTVYDELDRPIMTQDGEQLKLKKWTFVKYDFNNRPIITGVYTHSSFVDQTAMTALVSTTNFHETFNGAASEHGYTNTVFPTTNLDIFTVAYYDNYDFISNDPAYAYQPSQLPDQAPEAFERVTGFTTGGKVKVNDVVPYYLKTVTYYDNKYRIIQVISDNQQTGKHRVTGTYDFPGQVTAIKSVTSRNDQTASASSHTTVRKFDYDHAGRLKRVRHILNNEPEVLLVAYIYNALGQPIEKNLHSANSGSTFSQSVDYRYNNRGWLTSINNSQLAPDNGVSNNDTNDLFGMNLFYDQTDSGLNGTPAFNGNISGIKWSANQGAGTIKERAYSYAYDDADRITSASYSEKQVVWSTPSTNNSNSESGYSYDLNGNLLGLSRKAADGTPLDALTYDYGAGADRSNTLLKVTDTANKTSGFSDGVNIDRDYSYNVNGSLISDKNKNIRAITYNAFNQPDQITKENGDYVKYIYDGAGRKLGQRVYDVTNVLKKKVDYVGELYYENDTLKFIQHEEGRVVMVGSSPEYQYNLADHQGNIRMTFTSKQETNSATATFEETNEADEETQFLDLDRVKKIKHELFDHTNGTEEGYAIRLNGSANEKRGLAKSLAVMPGDKVKASVFAKYLDPNSGNWNAALTNLMTQVVTGTAAPGTVIDGAAYSTNSSTALPFAGLVNTSNSTGDGPKAYLNWIIFDRNFAFKTAGYARLSDVPKENGSDVDHEELQSPEITIEEPGYVYIYLSNENESIVEVFFDDLNVTHTLSPVIQSNDHFAFGMDNAALGYHRENSLKNNFLYNAGAEVQTDIDQDLYGTFFRSYDASIGRFMQIDPMAGKYASLTPYNYAFNDPVYWNDPMGADPWDDLQESRRQDAQRAYYHGNGIFPDDDLYGTNAYGSAFDRAGTSGFDYTYSSTFGGHWETGEITVSGNNPNSVNNNGEYSYTNTVRTWVPYTEPPGKQQRGQQGCPPGVDCAYINRVANEGLRATALSVGVVESNYGIWESNYNHTSYPTTKGRMKTIYKPDGSFRSGRAVQFGFYSTSVKRVGFGLSIVNLALSGYQMQQQVNNGQPIDPINAAQFGVGAVGLFASWLNYLGFGGRLMAPISATAGIFGMVLSIPGNWNNVYQGAYDMQYISTPYYPTDSEIFGGN